MGDTERVARGHEFAGVPESQRRRHRGDVAGQHEKKSEDCARPMLFFVYFQIVAIRIVQATVSKSGNYRLKTGCEQFS